MAFSLAPALEKFTAGVATLTTSPANIGKRLTDAYGDSIQYVKPENVPLKSRLQLQQIHRTMRAGDGTYEQTIDDMAVDDAIDMARAIFSLYHEVLCASYEDRGAHGDAEQY